MSHIRSFQKNEKTSAIYGGVTKDGKWTGRVEALPQNLRVPLTVKKPTTFAIWNDLFHADIPFEFIAAAFGVMTVCQQHTFIILTKRSDRMLKWFVTAQSAVHKESSPVVWGLVELETLWGCKAFDVDIPWPLPNVWIGVTAENQQTADERIPIFLQCPAAVRFISAEPLLGPINYHFPVKIWGTTSSGKPGCDHCCNGDRCDDPTHLDRRKCPYCHGTGYARKPDWVIVGGETGSKARPMHPDWARDIRDQCQEAGVPFFFKSFGDWSCMYDRDRDDPDWRNCPKAKSNNERYINLAGGHGFHGERVCFVKKVGKKRAGRELDGRTWEEFPK